MNVFPSIEGIDVFFNESGSITIEQESFMGEEPARVVVPMMYVAKICKALREVAAEAKLRIEVE